MYSASHPVSTPMNGLSNNLIDGSGTINPAALNNAGSLAPPSLAANPGASRGLKRSHSPEHYDVAGGHDDDGKSRKRNRPKPAARPAGLPPSPLSHPPPHPQIVQPAQMSSQVAGQKLPAAAPAQASPQPKPAPTKPTVKALPTVRDHTTDQLGPGNDEYVPREYDEAGEKKVDNLGNPLDGRSFKPRTFKVPNRGDKLFMLATECARVLNYRDSYLLFNKNRSLHKIIASQEEKDDLIKQEILPYSYRSRQIAIVTAKSMFRQFGSRVIEGGRRVRDDYWESKAIKQGFTENDMAGEKRPGGAKAREAAGIEAANSAAASANTNVAPAMQNDVIYSHAPHLEGIAANSMMPGNLSSNPMHLPMINAAPAEDPRSRDYTNVVRPRQEVTGPPYQDRITSAAPAEIINQSQHAADFNKVLGQQSRYRSKELVDHWNQPKGSPASSSPLLSTTRPQDTQIPSTQSLQSPNPPPTNMMSPTQPSMMSHHQAGMMQSQHTYPQQQSSHQANTLMHSPVQRMQPGMPSGIRPDQLHSHRPSALPTQQSSYGYATQSPAGWGHPPPQPQPSPLSASHHNPGLPQYSPHLQAHQTQSPTHHSPSPHHQPAALHHQSSTGSMPGYGTGPSGLGPGTNYPAMTPRAMYPTSQAGQQQPGQQYSMPQVSGGQGPGALQGWPTGAHAGQSQWGPYQ